MIGPGVPSSPLEPHDCRMFARKEDGGPGVLPGETSHKCDVCGAKVDVSGGG